jgi:hypothetical protein
LRFDAILVDSPAELTELVADALGREEDQIHLEMVDEAGKARAVTDSTLLSQLHAASVIKLANRPEKVANTVKPAKTKQAKLEKLVSGGRKLLPVMGRRRARGGHVALPGGSEDEEDDLEAAIRPSRRRCSSFDEDDALLSLAGTSGGAARGGGRSGRAQGRGAAGAAGKGGLEALD